MVESLPNIKYKLWTIPSRTTHKFEDNLVNDLNKILEEKKLILEEHKMEDLPKLAVP